VVAKDIVCMFASKQSMGKIMGLIGITSRSPWKGAFNWMQAMIFFGLLKGKQKGLIPYHTHSKNLSYNGG
jgi:hypothetical protein